MTFHPFSSFTPLIQANAITVSATNATSTVVDIEGSTNGAGQMVFIKDTSAVNGDHALTVEQAATSFDNTVAGNFTSLSTLSSTIYVSGQATQRGVVKVSHQGYADGSDSAASAFSIDLQTTNGGSTGTAAQGIFITSTTDAAPAGNAFTVRYNSLDQFVLKSSGLVGIAVAIGHTPAGMLEIAQKDTSTVGLFMQAIASGTDMVSLKDSGGSQRFQVNNAGNLISRANAFFTSPVAFGTTTSDAGGGGGGTLTICHNTDPTTNPASGHIILYCDASGNLLARTSAGNTRTVAAV